MSGSKGNMVKRILKGTLFFLAILSIVSLVVMFLWNWVMVDLFHLPEITFLKSAGLIILSKILFSGFKKPGGYSRHPSWGWKNKWKNMSEEEKEELKKKIKDFTC